MSLSIFEQIMLGVALGTDCFSVSMASGLILKKFAPSAMITAAVLFGVFQAMMPTIGWLCTVYFGEYIENIAHWIAFGLLCFLGGRMIKEGVKPGEQSSFNPRKLKVIFLLAIATSIDALAVGVSFTCMNMNTWAEIALPITIIGIMSTLMSLVGNVIGITIGKRFNIPAEIIGGVILILIGFKVLYEHLF